MRRISMFFVCVAFMLSAGIGLAQAPADQADSVTASTSSPVAFVYVTRPTHIDGFAVSSSGKLTPVPGSPFANIAASSLSVNKKFLFAAGDNNKDIYTFSIASDGAIKQVSEVNAQKYSDGCGTIGPLQIDNTGSTLYLQVSDPCQNSDFIQSFKIETNGDLQYLGSTIGEPIDVVTVIPPIRFIGDNKIGWEAVFGDDDGLVGSADAAYERKSDGSLVEQGGYSGPPNPKNPDDQYLTSSLTTDSTDHVASSLEDYSNDSGEIVGNDVLATYTSDSHGNLTTTSTYKNMPTTDLSPVTTMSISPSGKLLAAGGQGFQVFHFNGSSPITKYTGLLQANDSFEEFGWDADNHLYALSTDRLYVYTVTPTSIEEASGSPYSIPDASSVIVLEK
jgi:hypothetical protein